MITIALLLEQVALRYNNTGGGGGGGRTVINFTLAPQSLTEKESEILDKLVKFIVQSNTSKNINFTKLYVSIYDVD